jgi:hypothetical protein
MKKYNIILMLVIFLAALSSCAKKEEIAPDHKPLVMKGEAGKSVLTILLEHHEVDFEESEMGVFINAIDGVKNDSGHFWIYSVNGTPGDVSADKAIVSEGDTIEWRYK